jgi:hypothetical protein
MMRRDRRGEMGLAVWAALPATARRVQRAVSVPEGLADWWRDIGKPVAGPTCRPQTYISRCGEEGCPPDTARQVEVKRDCSRKVTPCTQELCVQRDMDY